MEVIETNDDHRAIIRRLLQLYHYDFSEFDNGDVDVHGEYLHRYFDEYWLDADRRALLFRVEGRWAGFALVFIGTPRDMAEFFVMRKFRNRGVGTVAAKTIVERYPGPWTVRQQLNNPDASNFWRKTIDYPYAETEVDGEVIQSFLVADTNCRL